MYGTFGKIVTTAILLNYYQKALSQTQCLQNLPPFGDQGKHSPALLVGIQALIPEYRITCAGTIIRWGMATEKRGKHRIDLQVWRSTDKSHQTDTYVLVGANTFNTQPIEKQKVLYLTPNMSEQIQVLPGDVIGFYLEDNTSISDDFKIQYKPNTTNIEVQYLTTREPSNMIYSDTLAVTLQNVAPIIIIELDYAPTTAAYPTDVNSTEKVFTTDETAIHNKMSHTVAITSTLIGILLFGMMLAVFIVLVVLIKTKTKGMVHVPHKQQKSSSKTQLTSTTNNNHSYMGVKQASTGELKDVKVHANPAYGHIFNTSSAHDYETPVLLNKNLTVTCLNNADDYGYETPQAFTLMESHDYEEPV